MSEIMEVQESRTRLTEVDNLIIKGGSGSGWKSPEHGGTHIAQSSSDGILTLKEAESYYVEHVAGIWSLSIKRKAGVFCVRVNFNENADHAYTKTNKATGKRELDLKRARLMQHIHEVISNPTVVLENGNRDLFVERVVDGNHYVVVLEWKQDAKEYRFRSAHYWTKKEFNDNSKSYKRPVPRGVKIEKTEAPKRLVKSDGASSTFTGLRDTSLVGSFESGVTPSKDGSCWPLDESIPLVASLVKSDKWLAVEPWGSVLTLLEKV